MYTGEEAKHVLRMPFLAVQTEKSKTKNCDTEDLVKRSMWRMIHPCHISPRQEGKDSSWKVFWWILLSCIWMFFKCRETQNIFKNIMFSSTVSVEKDMKWNTFWFLISYRQERMTKLVICRHGLTPKKGRLQIWRQSWEFIDENLRQNFS